MCQLSWWEVFAGLPCVSILVGVSGDRHTGRMTSRVSDTVQTGVVWTQLLSESAFEIAVSGRLRPHWPRV